MASLRRAWDNDSWVLDLLLCLAASAAVSFAAMHLSLACDAERRHLLYATLATVFATILGFNVTSVSILALVSKSEPMQKLRAERPAIYDRLLATFYSTIVTAILALLISLCSLVFDYKQLVAYELFASILFAALALLRLARSVSRLFAIIEL